MSLVFQFQAHTLRRAFSVLSRVCGVLNLIDTLMFLWINSVCLFADFTLSDPPIVSLRLGLELGSDALDEGQF